MLDCLFAGSCMIQLLPKCCLNCYVAFSFKIYFTAEAPFFLKTEALNLLQKKYFWILLPFCLPSHLTMTPQTLIVYQFTNYLISKTIVLSNQKLVKFYENNNIGLCDQQKISKKINLMWVSFFWNTRYN